jgi:hypothetical protein
MNKLIKIFLLLLFVFTHMGFSESDRIGWIRGEFIRINSSIETFNKISNPDIYLSRDKVSPEFSFEAYDIYGLAMANLDRFYESKKLKKAVVSFDSEREDQTSEYYYFEDKVFFVFKVRTKYKKSKWSDNFNKNDKEVFENRYYFSDNKLIKWIDSNKSIVNLEKVDKKIEKQIISDSELYRKIK